uniref:ATP synthase complex subunit 8 n=1 Tax=Cleridae sp. 1 ACP-2013 TaxID=1434446 RepID=A0A3G3MEC8_9CUCU|nr:ATP synthase F0 subunit 8 [Cleridae sp. 1 ACP-2013]AYW52249.1 ATP synthase F0 subunit 8 [Cleridae sp. 1 ACP-2013]
MPQMSPLSWVTLFVSFSTIFMFINSTNYFFINYKFNLKSNNLKLNNLNWKW